MAAVAASVVGALEEVRLRGDESMAYVPLSMQVPRAAIKRHSKIKSFAK
jgi:hypothetical protein